MLIFGLGRGFRPRSDKPVQSALKRTRFVRMGSMHSVQGVAALVLMAFVLLPPSGTAAAASRNGTDRDAAHLQAVSEKITMQEHRLALQDKRIEDLHQDLSLKANWGVGLLGMLLALVAIVAPEPAGRGLETPK